MCGIFCSFSSHGNITPSDDTRQLLQNRGPDHIGEHRALIETRASSVSATFISTVLALRGNVVVQQPLVDHATSSVLCWNGEAWSVRGERVKGNDSQLIFTELLEACASSTCESEQAVVDLLSSVRGPYALVFFDARNKRVYYGRDCLGRRSLLIKSTADGSLVLSSVCDNASGDTWAEVEADGLYILDFQSTISRTNMPVPTLIRHRRSDQALGLESSFLLPFPAMNRTISSKTSTGNVGVSERLKASLQASLRLRIEHVREAISTNINGNDENDVRIAILFSGGLDCTILARLCHDILPLSEPIDLINVAFENPRVHAKLDADISPYALCPDRITGRSSHAELTQTCPGRIWRFVTVDVPYTETQALRSSVMTLMHPHNTEMDLSISYALYFASRGVGTSRKSPQDASEAYTTPARVLLSGLGADELFGGYQRHETAFARRGYAGLIEELELDFDRLGKRNLGRDDRVISSSGKEVRFPFLDEDFIALALQLSVTEKCNFGCPEAKAAPDMACTLEPAKRALRLLACELGMTGVAREKKRAIQFGARTAKMETGKTKGNHVLT